MLAALSCGAGVVYAQEAPPGPPQSAPHPTETTPSRELARVPTGAVTLARPKPVSRRTFERASSRVQMPLRLQGAEGAVHKGKFKVTAGDATIETDEQGDPTVDLPAEGRTVVSSDEATKTAQHSNIVQTSKTALPWLVLDTHETQAGPSVLATRPFLQLARAIRWDETTKRHVVELLFGVDPEPGNPSDAELSPPFRARFSVSCDEVTPAEAAITKVGPAGYNMVQVSCSAAVKNDQSDHYVEIHFGNGNLRYPFELPRHAGPPVLVTSASSLAGLGVGATTLTIKRQEVDGTPLPAERDLSIQLLAAGGGTLSPSVLTLPAGRSEASVEVHPAGLGSLEISAVLGEQRSESVRLQLHWPWFAMLAMFGGAGSGAFLRYERNKRHRSVRRIAADVLSGVLVAAASLIVPAITALPAWARPTELAFLLIAAGAAFLGLDAFETVVRRLVPSLAPKDASSAVTK